MILFPTNTDVGYLNGIAIEMQDISDHFEKSIVKYEYPYVDGADLEDMGQKAGTVKTRCFFYDNAGQKTYARHVDFLNLLALPTDLEFIHPKYGILKGKVETVDVRHDDRKRTAEIDFTFIKRGFDKIQALPANAVDNIVETLYGDSADEQAAVIATDMVGSGLNVAAALTDESLLSQIKGVTNSARAYARQIDQALNRLNSLATDITQPLNSIVATINYGANLPGKLLGTVDRCLDRVAATYNGLRNFPARFLSAIDFGLIKIHRDLDSFLPADRTGAKAMLLKQILIASARRVALETAYVYGSDRDARRTQQSQGSVLPFDVNGKYTPRPPLDVAPMNVSELETTLAAARNRLQAEISSARSLHTLRDMALELAAAVDQVKHGGERIVVIDVTAVVPLHLLCLRQGIPYSDADRLMCLNTALRNPTFTTGTVQIFESQS